MCSLNLTNCLKLDKSHYLSARLALHVATYMSKYTACIFPKYATP